jgi:hypothetical protein
VKRLRKGLFLPLALLAGVGFAYLMAMLWERTRVPLEAPPTPIERPDLFPYMQPQPPGMDPGPAAKPPDGQSPTPATTDGGSS